MPIFFSARLRPLSGVGAIQKTCRNANRQDTSLRRKRLELGAALGAAPTAHLELVVSQAWITETGVSA